MAFPQPNFLTWDEISRLLGELAPGQNVTVTRIRYRNKEEIRRVHEMSLEVLREFIQKSMEEGDQSGGDLEVQLSSIGKTLVGHHDGVYWLEPKA